MTEDVIRAELSKFGNIEDVNIIKGKGFAFVRFDDHDPVDFCSCKYCLFVDPKF